MNVKKVYREAALHHEKVLAAVHQDRQSMQPMPARKTIIK